jgi:endogenous inhibitor of DNA gyrase (YacG/DUF329 family)
MSSILKMSCPHCNQTVPIFSKGWQDQRSDTKKICPVCRAPVKITLSGKTFALWFTPMVALAALALYVNAIQVGAWLFTLAFVLAVFASFQLDKAVA